MEKDTIASHVWKLALTKGILLTILGILIIIWPAASVTTAVMLIAAYIVVAAGVGIVRGFLDLKEGWSGVLEIAIGLLGVIFGIIILKNPVVSIIAYVYLIGIWFIIKGIHEIFSQGDKESQWLSVLGGILTLILGILLLMKPVTSGVLLFWVVGIYALFAGPIMIAISLMIRDKFASND